MIDHYDDRLQWKYLGGGATGWGRGHSVLTSLSFHRPGMQKDSRRSLPHRSKMRNSTDDKQAGGKRHASVNVMFTGNKHSRKETRGHNTGSAQVQILQTTHRSPRISSQSPG